MPSSKKPQRGIKNSAWLIFVLAGILGFLLYIQLWYKPEIVNSNLFSLTSILSGHRADIWSVRFSPDGKWLATGSVDSTVNIWDTTNKSLVKRLSQPSGVTAVTINRTPYYVASAGYDAKIRLWALPTGTLAKELVGHNGTVWSIDFSPNGKVLASSGEDGTIKVWDVETGRLLHVLKGHERNVWVVRISPLGDKVASGSFDSTIKIWDLHTGKLLKTIAGHSEAVVSMAFSHDGTILASTSDDKTTKLWATADWRLLKTLHTPEHAQAVDFSPNNELLVTAGRDKPALGEFLQNFLGDSKYNKGVSMRLWQVKTGKLLQTFSQHENDVNDVQFSPDGKWIAAGSSDRTVSLWKSSN
ncbi:WD40 repeat domain-containing protein [Rufibacter sp. DG15C]|uniref:WD40 repeat domain-containing protein n=1 Tax=Rufibacter sp. DG15C TaxID=1379909 RepID=UPI0009EBC13B|nr:WD40 repeat domain-containing protein [Rufibacter sp. DG15C]